MTLQEFNETNWKRGNVVKLKNGKEYPVKGTKCNGKYLLLFSPEYEKCFVADYRIVDKRTSDYEEPVEVYLEHKRKKQEEAEAKREAERQAYLQAKAERKRKNLEEQERIHQAALARKAAKLQMLAEQRKAEVQTPKAENNTAAKPKAAEEKLKAEAKVQPKVTERTNETVCKESAGTAASSEDKPKRKRQRITIKRVEKVQIK